MSLRDWREHQQGRCIRFTWRDRRRGRRAFTLIEMLVTVALIALLTSILASGLAAARRDAKRVLCQTRLKQIATGWHSYLSSSRGRFPRNAQYVKRSAGILDINYGGRQGVDPAYQCPKPLNRHLGLPLFATSGGEVFSCPEDQEYVAFAEGHPPGYFTAYGTSYFANPMLVGDTASRLGPIDPCYWLNTILDRVMPTLAVGQLSGESRLLLVGDGVWTSAWNSASKTPIRQWHRQPQRYNLAFVDGHVDFVKVRRGIHVSAGYTVMPTRQTQREAAKSQREINLPEQPGG